MNDINVKKQELRKKYSFIRSKIENKEAKSIKITNKLIESKEFKCAKVVALYKSIKSEVDTAKLIENALKLGKIVVLPKVFNSSLNFYKINSVDEKLVKSKFGIKEPEANSTNFIDKNKIDLIIVPGLAFDKENNRLGFGKGYYDRYLNSFKGTSIGICFSEQLLEKNLIPTNENDVKVKMVITDK